ncbi:hypothetical protein TIFTF001_005900 [Ficus carica]|uniref:Uncharacterized protein n=1 Tax=Ficus carica TaxID=3494 RepID=A0AA88DF63_FICCA|nr:hypothetical protein TIFTF001_005900 [Ficus carica]
MEKRLLRNSMILVVLVAIITTLLVSIEFSQAEEGFFHDHTSARDGRWFKLDLKCYAKWAKLCEKANNEEKLDDCLRRCLERCSHSHPVNCHNGVP